MTPQAMKRAYWRGQADALAASSPWPNLRMKRHTAMDIDREHPIKPSELTAWLSAASEVAGYLPSSEGAAFYENGFWSRIGELYPEIIMAHVQKTCPPAAKHEGPG